MARSRRGDAASREQFPVARFAGSLLPSWTTVTTPDVELYDDVELTNTLESVALIKHAIPRRSSLATLGCAMVAGEMLGLRCTESKSCPKNINAAVVMRTTSIKRMAGKSSTGMRNVPESSDSSALRSQLKKSRGCYRSIQHATSWHFLTQVLLMLRD